MGVLETIISIFQEPEQTLEELHEERAAQYEIAHDPSYSLEEREWALHMIDVIDKKIYRKKAEERNDEDDEDESRFINRREHGYALYKED